MKSAGKFLSALCFIVLAGVFSIHLSGCTNTSPAAPFVMNFNKLSAFATIGSFNYPAEIIDVSGNLWMPDYNTNTLYEMTASGTTVKTISTFNGGQSFNGPWGVSRDRGTGNIYVGDQNNGQIVAFNSQGGYLATFGNAQLSGYHSDAVAVNDKTRTVYAIKENPGTVFMYHIGGTVSNPTYTYTGSFGQTGPSAAILGDIYNVQLDLYGNLFIADYANNRVAEFSASGTYLKQFVSPELAYPSDAMADVNGNVFAVDYSNGWVVVFNANGTQVGKFGAGILSNPDGIATDGNGNYYVTDRGSGTIIAFH